METETEVTTPTSESPAAGGSATVSQAPSPGATTAIMTLPATQHRPLTRRECGKMTSLGLILLRKLKDETALKRSRIHPLVVLVAQKIYAQGHGDKGVLKWSPVSTVVDALDEAFYVTFQNVDPCNQPVLLALDVSGSMGCSMIAGSSLLARVANAAMLRTAATEPKCEIIAFSAGAAGYGGQSGGGESGITRVNLSPAHETGVIKRVHTLRQAFGSSMSDAEFDKLLKKKFPGLHAVALDTLLPDDAFFQALRGSANAQLGFDIAFY